MAPAFARKRFGEARRSLGGGGKALGSGRALPKAAVGRRATLFTVCEPWSVGVRDDFLDRPKAESREP